MRLVLAALLALALAAPASADPFGELPFRPVEGVATCLRATGAPGELARWTPTGVEVLRTDGTAIAPVETVGLGEAAYGCPQIASAPNGAAIVALESGSRAPFAVRYAVRPPGGRFGAPATAPTRGFVESVAASPRGDVLLVIEEIDRAPDRARLVADLLPAGASPPPPEPLTGWHAVSAFDDAAAGFDASGRATLAWTNGAKRAIEVATAAPGAGFGPAQRVGAVANLVTPALAVAPDGRALLAFAADAGLELAEREPGAAGFGPPQPLADADTVDQDSFGLALGDGGAAVVAWRDRTTVPRGVEVRTRATAGPFGAPRAVTQGRPSSSFGAGVTLVSLSGHTGPPLDQTPLDAAIAGSAFVLGWADSLFENGSGAPQAATGSLAGAPTTRVLLGSGLRPAASIASLALADGRAAVAWADDAMRSSAEPSGAGRVHVAVAGAPPAPDAPAPEVTVGPLGHPRLYPDQAVALPLRCLAACDVRAETGGGEYPVVAIGTREQAGPLTLELTPTLKPLESRHARHFTVTLRVSAPGAHTVAARKISVPLTLRTPPPVPKPLGVRVRRSGHDLIVSWRTAFPARRVRFIAFAYGKRLDKPSFAFVKGRGRTRFRARLRDARKASRLYVIASGPIGTRGKQVEIKLR